MTPGQVRKLIIRSMQVGRQYTFNDLINRTKLSAGVLSHNLIALRKMGLIAEPVTIQDVKAYRLAEMVAA